MSGFIWFLLIAFCVFFLVMCFQADSIEKEQRRGANEARERDEKTKQVYLEKLDVLKRENNISKCIENGYRYIDKPYQWNSYAFTAFDHENRNLFIYNTSSLNGFKKIPYNQIVNVELKTNTTQQTYSSNSTSKDMIKRAAVGGVIAGGTGAVIGALTTKNNSTNTTVTSQNIKSVILYLSNPNCPLVEVDFFDWQSKYQDFYATVLAIISQNQQNNITSDLENCNNEW